MKKGFFIIFIWTFLLYSVGVKHFLKGFLLTRHEIHLKSTVSDGTSCCLKSKYEKVIILMIDALRYDFLLYDNNTSEGDIPIAHNNMPIVEQLLKDEHGVLYQVKCYNFKNNLNFTDCLLVCSRSPNYHYATFEGYYYR